MVTEKQLNGRREQQRTFHWSYSSGSLRMVATIAAPWRGGLENMGRMTCKRERSINTADVKHKPYRRGRNTSVQVHDRGVCCNLDTAISGHL